MRASDVPAGPVLVDTDVFSFLTWRRARYEEFADLINGHPFVLSFATVGELRAGAIKAQWGERRRRALEDRIRECVVLPATDRVVDAYAVLHARYRDNLKKDGSNDMWTVACAVAQSPPLPVVTNNLADFEQLRQTFGFFLVHPDR